MAVTYSVIVPHPPLIIPEIGKGKEEKISDTINSYIEISNQLVESNPDTIIFTTPHTVMYSDYNHISPGKNAKGNFESFGAPQVNFNVEYDSKFVSTLSQIATDNDFFAGTLGESDANLDHGVMVPLFFIKNAYEKENQKIVPIVRVGLSGMSLADHYRLGMYIEQTAQKLNKDIAFVASGDLSHKLKHDGPYGFDEAGPKYDTALMRAMEQGDFGKLFDFPTHILDKAAECGHRSFVIMAGALDGKNVEAKKLSYQDDFGVGYGIVSFKPLDNNIDRKYLNKYNEKYSETVNKTRENESFEAGLARQSIEQYVLNNKIIDIPKNTPSRLTKRTAGAFVTLKIDGQLKGCIGTTSPASENLAKEIINNAISAATRDTRFEPVTSKELSSIIYSVEVLGDSEEVKSKDQLDTGKYGIIVSKDLRRGVLLPNIDGVDDVDHQISIALQKAGIAESEDYTLERFEVKSYS